VLKPPGTETNKVFLLLFVHKKKFFLLFAKSGLSLPARSFPYLSRKILGLAAWQQTKDSRAESC
jgi:hypothetical protein